MIKSLENLKKIQKHACKNFNTHCRQSLVVLKILKFLDALLSMYNLNYRYFFQIQTYVFFLMSYFTLTSFSPAPSDSDGTAS